MRGEDNKQIGRKKNLLGRGRLGRLGHALNVLGVSQLLCSPDHLKDVVGSSRHLVGHGLKGGCLVRGRGSKPHKASAAASSLPPTHRICDELTESPEVSAGAASLVVWLT